MLPRQYWPTATHRPGLHETLAKDPPVVPDGRWTVVACQAPLLHRKAIGLPWPPLAVQLVPTARQSFGLRHDTSDRTLSGVVTAGLTPAG